jgi:hypothetical protein
LADVSWGNGRAIFFENNTFWEKYNPSRRKRDKEKKTPLIVDT